MPYGPAISVLVETPVSGYYLLVMRHHINSETVPEWTDLPQWNFKRPAQLFLSGLALNAIMCAYTALMIVMLTIVAAGVFSAAHIVHGLSQSTIVADALLTAATALATLPLLWSYAFLLPLAIARFAHTNNFFDAFDIPFLLRLATRRSRLAALGALIFLSAVAVNMPLTVLSPQISPLTEPSIEFVSIVAAAVIYGRAFRRKVCADERGEIDASSSIKDGATDEHTHNDCLECKKCLNEN
ncbi:MAG: DUF4013 domain-containing protein [Leptolyngbya sp.]|nr:DUF4013 domain-containing protein [Candidatus Melainabacteria bacterium]